MKLGAKTEKRVCRIWYKKWCGCVSETCRTISSCDVIFDEFSSYYHIKKILKTWNNVVECFLVRPIEYVWLGTVIIWRRDRAENSLWRKTCRLLIEVKCGNQFWTHMTLKLFLKIGLRSEKRMAQLTDTAQDRWHEPFSSAMGCTWVNIQRGGIMLTV